MAIFSDVYNKNRANIIGAMCFAEQALSLICANTVTGHRKKMSVSDCPVSLGMRESVHTVHQPDNSQPRTQHPAIGVYSGLCGWRTGSRDSREDSQALGSETGRCSITGEKGWYQEIGYTLASLAEQLHHHQPCSTLLCNKDSTSYHASSVRGTK